MGPLRSEIILMILFNIQQKSEHEQAQKAKELHFIMFEINGNIYLTKQFLESEINFKLKEALRLSKVYDKKDLL